MFRLVSVIVCTGLVSGCANPQQSINISSLLSPSANVAAVKQAGGPVGQTATVKPPQKASALSKKRVAAASQKQRVNRPPKPATKKPAAAPRHRPQTGPQTGPQTKTKTKPVRTASASTSAAAPDCQARLSKLPPDADRRPVIVRVQCFFTERGEYLTDTGATKPLP